MLLWLGIINFSNHYLEPMEWYIYIYLLIDKSKSCVIVSFEIFSNLYLLLNNIVTTDLKISDLANA